MSIFDVEVYFLHITDGWRFCIYCAGLCLFIGELTPLILRFINDKSLFDNSCYFVVVVFGGSMVCMCVRASVYMFFLWVLLMGYYLLSVFL